MGFLGLVLRKHLTYLFLLEFNGALRRRQAASSQWSEVKKRLTSTLTMENDRQDTRKGFKHTHRHVWVSVNSLLCVDVMIQMY